MLSITLIYSDEDCAGKGLLEQYLLSAVLLFWASIVCDWFIMLVSLNGSIIESEKVTSTS
jgi:hypothetical protein